MCFNPTPRRPSHGPRAFPGMASANSPTIPDPRPSGCTSSPGRRRLPRTDGPPSRPLHGAANAEAPPSRAYFWLAVQLPNSPTCGLAPLSPERADARRGETAFVVVPKVPAPASAIALRTTSAWASGTNITTFQGYSLRTENLQGIGDTPSCQRRFTPVDTFVELVWMAYKAMPDRMARITVRSTSWAAVQPFQAPNDRVVAHDHLTPRALGLDHHLFRAVKLTSTWVTSASACPTRSPTLSYDSANCRGAHVSSQPAMSRTFKALSMHRRYFPAVPRAVSRVFVAQTRQGHVAGPWFSLAALYAAALARHKAWGFLAERALPTLVVGNLVAGPHAMDLAKRLESRLGTGTVAILSRGHGRSSNMFQWVDEGCTWQHVGDEPWMMARALHPMPVAVGANRLEALRAMAHTRPELKAVVLDDGMQHRALVPDRLVCLQSRPKATWASVLPAGPGGICHHGGCGRPRRCHPTRRPRRSPQPHVGPPPTCVHPA